MLWLGRSEVHVFWESESKIPQPVIREFESGQMMETIQLQLAHNYGLESSKIVPTASTTGAHLTEGTNTRELHGDETNYWM